MVNQAGATSASLQLTAALSALFIGVPVAACATPGGYAVLKGIQGGLALPATKMLPSFAALRDYGNTSCSTTWYVMAYMESCDQVLRGQKIMQVWRPWPVTE
jgi:predicted naringenin-chalcone synthase